MQNEMTKKNINIVRNILMTGLIQESGRKIQHGGIS